MATLKEMRDAVKSWATQEKKEIDAGERKPPSSSLEKFMADKNPKDLKKTNFSSNAKSAMDKVDDPNSDLHPDVRSMLTAIRADADKSSVPAPSKNLRPNPPVASQSRMDVNKPVKTALVRQIAPGRNRLAEAVKRRERYPNGVRVMSPGLTKAESEGTLPPHPDLTTGQRRGGWNRDALKEMRMQSAAETSEAQASVGVMKADTGQLQAHKDIQTRWDAIWESIKENRSESPKAAAKATATEKKFNSMSMMPAYPNKKQPGAGGQRFTPLFTDSPPGTVGQTKSDIRRPHKDLGRITLNLIRGAGKPGSSVDEAGGQILRQALAKKLGYNTSKLAGKASGAKAPRAGKGKTISGNAPSMVDLHDHEDLTTPPGWKRKLIPGDL